MSFAYLVSLLLLGSIAFGLVREMSKASPRPAGLRGHIRARGWGLALLPAAAMAAVMTGHVHALAVAELATAGALVTWAPRLAAKLAPYALLALGLFGLILAKAYHDGFSSQVLYGLVPAGGGPFRRGFVLPQAGVFFVLGTWLLLRVEAPGAGPVRALIARWLDPRRGGISARQGLFLIPVTALALQLLGPGNWFGMQAITGLDVAVIDLGVATAMLVLVFRSRVWAATLAEAGLLVLGGQVPGLPVLVLSQYVEQLYARELLADQAGAVGYLLKDRVFNDDQFTGAIRTVAAGGTVLDPEVVQKLMVRHSRTEPVARLTPREREVLGLMAEGRSNAAIAQRLFITEKAVSKHAAGIFGRLGLEPSDDDNRRVLAVLAYLGSC